MKATLLLLLGFILVFSYLASQTKAATINAVSCSQADVQAAVSSASSGDMVTVPPGNCTWSSTLAITKGLTLKGSGAGNTTIIGSMGMTNFIISYMPATPSLNEPFRLTGFTFDLNKNSLGIFLYNPSTAYPVNKIRIDHNSVLNMSTGPNWASMAIAGQVYGVMDNNLFSGDGHFDIHGSQENSWNSLTFEYGSPANFYFEDNTWVHSDSTLTSGAGGRWVARYNTFTSTKIDGTLSPWLDGHGNQPGGIYAIMGIEIYGNVITSSDPVTTIRMFTQRGGKALMFFNKAVNFYVSSSDTEIWEEYADSICPTTNAQPQHVSDSYYWNNRVGTTLKNAIPYIDCCSGLGGFGPDSRCCPSIAENSEWYNHNTSFNGISGMGCGPLANLPSNCTMGVGYWATNQSCSSVDAANIGRNPTAPISGTLYKCAATNTWTAYYTPYTYPHPLRLEGPVCGNFKTEPGEACDGADINNYTCSSLPGFRSGTLKCKPDCSGYNISSCVSGNTINAASCSYADVQAAVNSASDGDTVKVPAGTCTWANTFPLTKGITLKGESTNDTFITDGTPNTYWNAVLEITGTEGKPFRITGISFIDVNDCGIMVYGTAKNWRIDHCNILAPATQWGGAGINVYPNGPGYSYGLIDHCYIRNMNTASAQMFADVDAGWNRPLTLGTGNAIYLEDCIFDSRLGLSSATDSSAGVRFVLRHSTLTNSIFHLHGTDGGSARSTHSYEYYSNTLSDDGTVNCYISASLRGGTGVLFDNTLIGNWGYLRVEHNCAGNSDPNDNRCGGAKFCTGYPCLDQIGRTTDSNGDGMEDLAPLYAWNNTDDGIRKDLVISTAYPEVYTYLQEGRDFYNNGVTYNSLTGMYEALYTDDDGSTKKWSYKPYVYPHPLALLDQSCHKSDTNCNGCVSMSELTVFINRWKINNQDVTIRELIEAIGLWKKGC